MIKETQIKKKITVFMEVLKSKSHLLEEVTPNMIKEEMMKNTFNLVVSMFYKEDLVESEVMEYHYNKKLLSNSDKKNNKDLLSKNKMIFYQVSFF